MRLFPVLATLLALLNAPPAFADRPFPAHAKRGLMTPAYHPDIIIDGKTRRLAPAARIFNQDNLIEMPASLRGKNIVVNYVEDREGMIVNVWMLTPEEAGRRAPAGDNKNLEKP
jgi:hypothetical protein